MTTKLIAVTNNSLITRTMADKNIFSQIVFSRCTSSDILKISMNMIKAGSVLLINPLLGAVPPYEMPFKTVILSEGGEVIDFNSLNVISDAVRKTEKALGERTRAAWGKNELDGFKKNDLLIIERWLMKVYLPTRIKMRAEDC